MTSNQITINTPKLPVHHYRFTFSNDPPLKLPTYAGSAWRGAFGHALKKTVCVVRRTPCQQCLLLNSCAFPYIFDTPLPPNAVKMRKYNHAPHPFVLQLPDWKRNMQNGYTLDLLIFGNGQRFFPYMLYALQNAGKEGIGGARQVFELQQVEKQRQNGDWEVVYRFGELGAFEETSNGSLPPMPEAIELTLHTPMRIKQHGHNINAENFQFGVFFSILLRRISMLTYFHTDTPLDTDFANLTQRAREKNFSGKQLKWFDWKRYSSRQDAEMSMGGVIGKVTLNMHGLDDFWPYLWLGQWTHVGKATSMGLGQYSLRATSLPES